MKECAILEAIGEGKTYLEIRKEFKVSNNTILSIKKKNNIKTRDKAFTNIVKLSRFDIEMDWLESFDIEIIQFFNNCIRNKADSRFAEIDSVWYKAFVEKFYYDKQFNDIYSTWIKNGKKQMQRPSLDHIVPRHKGGTDDLSNLQFLTWFENKCKSCFAPEDWDSIKSNIWDYFYGIH